MIKLGIKETETNNNVSKSADSNAVQISVSSVADKVRQLDDKIEGGADGKD